MIWPRRRSHHLQVLQILAHADRPLSTCEVAARPYPPLALAVVDEALRRHARRSWVCAVDGRWAITDAGLAAMRQARDDQELAKGTR